MPGKRTSVPNFNFGTLILHGAGVNNSIELDAEDNIWCRSPQLGAEVTTVPKLLVLNIDVPQRRPKLYLLSVSHAIKNLCSKISNGVTEKKVPKFRVFKYIHNEFKLSSVVDTVESINKKTVILMDL